MRTIESTFIFPITLVVFSAIIILCFNLHDMVLCKSAGYKYLVYSNAGALEPAKNETLDCEPLEDYIYNFSLSNSNYSIDGDTNTIEIVSNSYDSSISFEYYNNCDFLRKTFVAAEFIENLTTDN